MILLIDIGNTHTHFGLAAEGRVRIQANFPTAGWSDRSILPRIERFIRRRKIDGASLCSVVPRATVPCAKWLRAAGISFVELNANTVRCIGIDYPRPETIGPDRLANAVAAFVAYGAPAVVVDFGTAVTFDVVDRRGAYVGGIIAPGLSAMTDYLHEKTALLPRIRIRDVEAVVGKNTREAMLVGAVHGYRGLVRALIGELKLELKTRKLPVLATGGYARLIAKGVPEITAVEPDLTLRGLLHVFEQHRREQAAPP
jgi:type III pantothenate kinase